jgi:hypothetical protein
LSIQELNQIIFKADKTSFQDLTEQSTAAVQTLAGITIGAKHPTRIKRQTSEIQKSMPATSTQEPCSIKSSVRSTSAQDKRETKIPSKAQSRKNPHMVLIGTKNIRSTITQMSSIGKELPIGSIRHKNIRIRNLNTATHVQPFKARQLSLKKLVKAHQLKSPAFCKPIHTSRSQDLRNPSTPPSTPF